MRGRVRTAEIKPPETAPANDIEEEEELDLIAPEPGPAPKAAPEPVAIARPSPKRPVLVLNTAPPAPANDVGDEDVEAPPFDAPDESDLLGLNEVFEDDEFVDEDAPFDAPDDIEESVGAMHVAAARELPTIELADVVPIEAPRPKEVKTLAPVALRVEPAAPPAPPISVHASWDRSESGEVFAAFAEDKRLARAEIGISRGGLDGAAAALRDGDAPDLLIVDTDLSAGEILAGVSALMQQLSGGTKIIVIGAVNDIGVLRSLQQRGVAAYMMAPVDPEELVRTTCELFARTDRARVIAVMGARGGVGSSTLAQNLAWTIADKLDAPTALVDLDVGFGAASSVFKLEAQGFVTDLMSGDEAALDRALTQAHDRLLVAAAPGSPNLAVGLQPEAVEAMLARVRRTSAFVVLDLPHVWTTWMREALVGADEIVLVAGPDLASLRNTDNLIKTLRDAREGRPAPMLALSMTGVPKRPEIAAKEFAESVNVAPIATFAFDPELFGEAEASGRLLVQAAPKSKPALAIEDLACALTGRMPVIERKPKPRRDVPKAKETAPALIPALEELPPLELSVKDEAPAEPALHVESAPAVEPVVAEEPPPAAAPATGNDRDDLTEIERAYIERARRKAMAELDARRAKRRRRGTDSRTLVRFLGVTAASSALMLVTTWSVREQAHPPQAPAPVQSVTLPAAAVVDPVEALARDYDEAITLLAANDPRGLVVLRRAAEEGSALAQYRLAKIYEAGDGVEIDPIVARQWTERAAAAGNVRAMHDLGYYFARGDAAPLDEAAAFRWFRQAAEFGFADSQYNLGVLYEQGRGVTANDEEALFWFTLAANNGDVAAVERVTQLQGDLTVMQIEQARARADAFTPRAPNPAANEAG